MKKRFKTESYVVSINPPLPPKNRRVAVWPGDPHLGDENASAALCELFVRGHIAKKAMIILTGDLFDSWLVLAFANRLSWSDRLFLHILLGRTGIFIPGNHDWFLRPFIPLLGKATKRWKFPNKGERHILIEIGGTLCYFEHGDHFDGIISHWSFTTLVYVFGWVGKIVRWLKGDRQLLSSAIKQWTWFWRKTADRVANGVISAAHAHKATVCGAGHTHLGETREIMIDGIRMLYVNAGSFDGNESYLTTFSVEETGGLRVILHTITTRRNPLLRE